MLIIMTNNKINFNPATMNPAAIILPNVETFNINNYLDYIIILLILILIGFIIIKKHLL